MSTYVRPAIPGDTWLLLPDIRQPDLDEMAALGASALECMQFGMAHSDAWVIFIHDQPAGMYGCVDHQDFGVPWAIFTNVIDKHPLPFIRESRRFVDSLEKRLENYVDVRNTLTVNWLLWLGFTVDDPQPIGINGEPFARFWRASVSRETKQEAA